MAFGKLEITPVSDAPAFVQTWLLERRVDEVKKWISENYGSTLDTFGFEDWENADDLEIDLDSLAIDTRTLVKDLWGVFLSESELMEIVVSIDPDGSNDWYPIWDRISIEEDEEYLDLDETFLDLKDIQDSIDLLRDDLQRLKAQIPATIGHNQPPKKYALGFEDVEAVEQLMDEVAELDEADLEDNISLISRLAKSSMSLGEAAIRYAGQKVEAFVDASAKSAGAEIGKWGVRLGIIGVAGEKLIEFAKRLLDFISEIM